MPAAPKKPTKRPASKRVVPQHRERIFFVGFRECEKAG
jgi:site-specific DNA-cytosine methylase